MSARLQPRDGRDRRRSGFPYVQWRQEGDREPDRTDRRPQTLLALDLNDAPLDNDQAPPCAYASPPSWATKARNGSNGLNWRRCLRARATAKAASGKIKAPKWYAGIYLNELNEQVAEKHGPRKRAVPTLELMSAVLLLQGRRLRLQCSSARGLRIGGILRWLVRVLDLSEPGGIPILRVEVCELRPDSL